MNSQSPQEFPYINHTPPTRKESNEIPETEQRIYQYISLGIEDADSCSRYKSWFEAKATADKIISMFYRRAEAFFRPGEDSLAAAYSRQYANRIFEKYLPIIEKKSNAKMEQPQEITTVLSLLENATQHLRHAFDNELWDSSDYYQLYAKSYFVGQIAIEEHDYTVDVYNSSFLNALARIVSQDRDYTLENVIDTIMELEEDTNRRADTFSKAAFAIYRQYCERIEQAIGEAFASPKE